MPYADPEVRRQYQREYQRARRTEDASHAASDPRLTPASEALAAVRLRRADDVLAVLEEQTNSVRGDTRIGVLEKARTIGYLATVLLRAIETADIESRLTALEGAHDERTT